MLHYKQHGQALVETAIIAPIVVLLLLGIFEVGWALRGYLVLANANREAARFATRPNYLDFTEQSYLRVYSHALDSISNQIPFTKYGTIIISHFYVATDWPCNPADVYNEDGTITPCDCDNAIVNPYTPTLVLTPIGVPTFTFKYPVTSTKTTNLDYATYAQSLVAINRQLNCESMNRGSMFKPQVDDVIVVEMFYDQPQLFGFPLLSNAFTDPVPMYSHTAMRILVGRQ